MKEQRIAVIDLGSNTFHLLICELHQHGSWVTLLKERVYVKLADGGLELIEEDAIKRAIDAMLLFKDLIQIYEVGRTRAIGTSALREAWNGVAVAEKLSEVSGIPIEIIDGHQEARFILGGIKSVLPEMDQYGLIMDIGGGSVEFILFKKDVVAFAESFKIGVAVLYDTYHHSDPISKVQIQLLEQELDDKLASLIKVLKKTSVYYLIGASGSFEVLYDVLPKSITSTHWSELEITGIVDIMNKVIIADIEERRKMHEIPEERIDYIVVAYILIRYLFKKIAPSKLYYCEFALKEGVVEEMIRTNNE
jgi:exopolyphosphatase / guanosine-5'-triphosphate,3'-diphosphate pyrophosphatase